MAIYITGDTHGYYPQLMDRLAGNNCHLTKMIFSLSQEILALFGAMPKI